jgi:hypothetical protein
MRLTGATQAAQSVTALDRRDRKIGNHAKMRKRLKMEKRRRETCMTPLLPTDEELFGFCRRYLAAYKDILHQAPTHAAILEHS